MLVGTAIYILTGLLMGFVGVSISAISERENLLGIVYLGPIALLMAILLCIFGSWGDRLANKIVGKPEPAGEQIFWLPAAFRLTCVAAGILLLYRSIPYFMMTFYVTLTTAMKSEGNFRWPISFWTIAGNLIFLAVGMYLAFGAPKFVRWQVRKTLEQCKTMDTTP